jgi:preprotein translocase subunit SecY
MLIMVKQAFLLVRRRKNSLFFLLGGIAYYISPPNSLSEMVSDPLHLFVYVAFVLTTCALFAKVN